MGIWGFIGNQFMADKIADAIGWKKDRSFKKRLLIVI